MNYTGLTDERQTWAYELKHGIWHEPYILQQYRIGRESNLWRSTREVEKLCEYILFLEGAKTMSQSILITCDQCKKDITKGSQTSTYRIRLLEEIRPQDEVSGQFPVPELGHQMNFCNLEHLKQWLISQ